MAYNDTLFSGYTSFDEPKQRQWGSIDPKTGQLSGGLSSWRDAGNGVDINTGPDGLWYPASLLAQQKQWIDPQYSAAPTSFPSAPTAYTPSPTPNSGTNAFGMVPGQLGLPDPGADLRSQIPGLAGLNAQTSGVISDYLGGNVPLDVQQAIQNSAAQFGISSGMPGSGLARNIVPRDLGLTSLDLQKRGMAAYGPFVGAVSQTQTLNPALQAQIAETNSINAAAPDPTKAASYAKKLFDEYMNNLKRSGGGGVAGGTGNFSMPSASRGRSFAAPMAYSGYGGQGNFDQSGGYGFSQSAIPQSYGGGGYQQSAPYSGPPSLSAFAPEQDYSTGFGEFDYFGNSQAVPDFFDPEYFWDPLGGG